MFERKKLSTIVLLIFALSSCANSPISSRDISRSEKESLSNYRYSPINTKIRQPANWANDCLNSVGSFFKPKPKPISIKPLPELTQLNPEMKQFPNGKKYTQYTANVNVMNKYPDYEQFLKQTVEVIFEPVDPFGHINLRVGETVYSFNYIKSTSMNKFSPRMRKSSNAEMPSSRGFVFQLDEEKILALKKEIENFYKSSASHNVPPFDAYSPLLKIVESNGAFGKSLKYETTSPKHGNTSELKGKIMQEGNLAFLDNENGIKLPLVKKGNDYYVQSYSCSSSAEYILKNFFGIDISHAYSAKSLNESLLKGNIDESISPIAVIKYYED